MSARKAKELGQYELEVGLSSDERDVVVNHPEMIPSPGGRGGHIVFTPTQARDFATLMLKKASECVGERPGSWVCSHCRTFNSLKETTCVLCRVRRRSTARQRK